MRKQITSADFKAVDLTINLRSLNSNLETLIEHSLALKLEKDPTERLGKQKKLGELMTKVATYITAVLKFVNEYATHKEFTIPSNVITSTESLPSRGGVRVLTPSNEANNNSQQTSVISTEDEANAFIARFDQKIQTTLKPSAILGKTESECLNIVNNLQKGSSHKTDLDPQQLLATILTEVPEEFHLLLSTLILYKQELVSAESMQEAARVAKSANKGGFATEQRGTSRLALINNEKEELWQTVLQNIENTSLSKGLFNVRGQLLELYNTVVNGSEEEKKANTLYTFIHALTAEMHSSKPKSEDARAHFTVPVVKAILLRADELVIKEQLGQTGDIAKAVLGVVGNNSNVPKVTNNNNNASVQPTPATQPAQPPVNVVNKNPNSKSAGNKSLPSSGFNPGFNPKDVINQELKLSGSVRKVTDTNQPSIVHTTAELSKFQDQSGKLKQISSVPSIPTTPPPSIPTTPPPGVSTAVAPTDLPPPPPIPTVAPPSLPLSKPPINLNTVTLRSSTQNVPSIPSVPRPSMNSNAPQPQAKVIQTTEPKPAPKNVNPLSQSDSNVMRNRSATVAGNSNNDIAAMLAGGALSRGGASRGNAHQQPANPPQVPGAGNNHATPNVQQRGASTPRGVPLPMRGVVPNQSILRSSGSQPGVTPKPPQK